MSYTFFPSLWAYRRNTINFVLFICNRIWDHLRSKISSSNMLLLRILQTSLNFWRTRKSLKISSLQSPPTKEPLEQQLVLDHPRQKIQFNRAKPPLINFQKLKHLEFPIRFPSKIHRWDPLECQMAPPDFDLIGFLLPIWVDLVTLILLSKFDYHYFLH